MKRLPYPLTIVADRYQGAYSGGLFTAWNKMPDKIPTEIFGEDGTCMDFWGGYADEKEDGGESGKYKIGLGETPSKAIADLISKLKSK